MEIVPNYTYVERRISVVMAVSGMAASGYLMFHTGAEILMTGRMSVRCGCEASLRL
jgi:hypothetical protein